MTLELATTVFISLTVICFICYRLSREDERFDEKFREEEEE